MTTDVPPLFARPAVPPGVVAAGSDAVLDQLADGYFELDRAYRYRRVNTAGARFVGLPVSALLGRGVLELFPEVADAEVHRAVGRAMTGGGPEHIETYYAPLGMWALNSVYALPDGVAIVTHDLTDQRRAEERDRALAAIDTAADDAIVTKTLDGTITSWNPAAERLFGWTAAEMSGHSITRIVPPERREELAELSARVSRGEPIEHHETVRVTRDGRRLDISVSISPLIDTEGRVIGAVKIGRDISARRAAEELREDFFAAVAHDLKNPIGGIKANAQLLLRRLRRDDGLEADRFERGLSAIDAAATRMVGLLDGLVEAARLEAGETPPLVRASVDLVALAGRCVAEYEATPAHAVRLETAVAELLGHWDAAQLERVLSNLVSNALKYSPGGGDVVVGVAQKTDGAGVTWAVLAVRDRGLGIPHADLPRVFDRFRRGGNVGGITGTGLGLTGARQIVTQHGGTITLASSEGMGTTVTVRLPLSPADEPAVAADTDRG